MGAFVFIYNNGVGTLSFEGTSFANNGVAMYEYVQCNCAACQTA